METVKKALHFLSTVLLYSLFAILIIIGILLGMYAIDQFTAMKNHEDRAPLFGAYVIISPSMVPNINVYDAVFTVRAKEKDIELYDIITFLSKEIDTNGTPITHRVVGIVDTEAGAKAYRTKGDNNSTEDRSLILQKEVIGKVLFRIPMIGYVKTFLSSKLGWIVAVVVPCFGIIAYDILKLTGLVKTKKKDKTEDIGKKPSDGDDNSNQNNEEPVKKEIDNDVEIL